MSAEQTEFVGDIPTKSISTVLAFVRGQSPSKSDLALAAINVQSYAAGKFLGDPTPAPVFAATGEPTNAQVEAVLVQMSPDSQDTMAAESVKSAGLLLLLQFLGPLLLKWLLNR